MSDWGETTVNLEFSASSSTRRLAILGSVILLWILGKVQSKT
jgi:hypothetical protein